MGIFFFGQTKLDFFSFSGGVSSLMLAYFLKILPKKSLYFQYPQGCLFISKSMQHTF
jgi:hypothetical protein